MFDTIVVMLDFIFEYILHLTASGMLIGFIWNVWLKEDVKEEHKLGHTSKVWGTVIALILLAWIWI